jgi:DNA replication initiation complex subunit (GINS family)
MLELVEAKVRQEKEQRELSRLDEDFFVKLQQHIQTLSLVKDPIAEKHVQLLREAAEELVDVRAEKIFKGHHTGMLTEEGKLAELASTFKKFKKDVLKSLLQKEITTEKVVILKDLPQFYGPELEILGPYTKGDVVLLERTVATLLKERGLVEKR